MSKRLSIAVIAACPFPYDRGTPLRIQRLSEGLSAMGQNVHIFTYPIGNDHTMDGVHISRTSNPLGYKKFDSGPSIKKPFIDALLTSQVAQFLSKSEIDIIYAHHFEGAITALLARRGRHIPVVYDAHTTLNGELGSYHKLLRTKPVTLVGQWLDGFIPRRVDHIISVSDEIAEFLRKLNVPSERISVITNGTEIEEFAQADASRALEKFHLETRPTLIYTGNLALFQGIDYLLNAMPEVLSKLPNAQLILAGRGDFEPYTKMITELGIQYATRFIPNPTFTEVIDLLAMANVAVVPRTICPGIPLKLLNYMAAGKAIVAFEGSAKILSHLDTGYIVKNADVPALASGIIMCLTNSELSNDLGIRAKQTIIQSYTWDRMAAKVNQVFEHLVAGNQLQVPND